MLLKNQLDVQKKQTLLQDVKESNRNLHSMVAFRITNEQLHKLKLEAVKEKRSVSNYIKAKLF